MCAQRKRRVGRVRRNRASTKRARNADGSIRVSMGLEACEADEEVRRRNDAEGNDELRMMEFSLLRPPLINPVYGLSSYHKYTPDSDKVKRIADFPIS
jgi:hypothetical protein